MAFTEDLSPFFDTKDFAVTATYTPSGGSAVEIPVIFDDAYEALNQETGAVESSAPQVQVKTSDVPNAGRGDTLLVNSTTYKVILVQPDGTGVTTLILSQD